IDPGELGAVAERLAAYLGEHYRLRADSGGDPRLGRILQGELVGLALDEPGPGAPASEQWIELVLDYRTEALITDLLLEVTIFLATSPDHRDICELTWNETVLPEVVFSAGARTRFYAPPSLPVARPSLDWIAMGCEHILGGWDHLAFVLALIVSARGWRNLLWVVTAFTLAHSLTLALAALDLVDVPERPVEIAIAASILWLGVANLLAKRPRSRWPEAFAFGLVHGLGFAGFLGAALWREPRRLLPLAGFNLGVELGQLAVVLAVALPLVLLRRAARGATAEPASRWLAPRWLRLPVSAGVALAGAWWLAARAGWVAA
ncbi:MAG TPA: HupE/UreJ family protein, partial [Planctomycetota bacterium]|nr:HupE/UreJ family protein [Planctomycetota bacterium]